MHLLVFCCELGTSNLYSNRYALRGHRNVLLFTRLLCLLLRLSLGRFLLHMLTYSSFCSAAYYASSVWRYSPALLISSESRIRRNSYAQALLHILAYHGQIFRPLRTSLIFSRSLLRSITASARFAALRAAAICRSRISRSSCAAASAVTSCATGWPK